MRRSYNGEGRSDDGEEPKRERGIGLAVGEGFSLPYHDMTLSLGDVGQCLVLDAAGAT